MRAPTKVIICTLHTMRQELVQSRTCEGMISSIMMIDFPLVLSEYVKAVVKLLAVINFVALHIEKANVTALREKTKAKSLLYQQSNFTNIQILSINSHIMHIPVTSTV